MLVEPYNKANCIAMLNTLFPPVTESTARATPQLTPHVLKSQRDGFFRYISAIDTNGKKILDQVILHGAPPGERNGWPLVRDALDKYLRSANDMIDACAMVSDLGSLEEEESRRKGHNRKPDSGVSFGAASVSSNSGNSNNTGINASHNSSSESVLDKPLPPSPAEYPVPKSHGSTLERLTRELRKIGDSGKSKSIKKMKSNSTLASSRSEHQPSHSADASFFDVDEQKRRRLVWEASTRKTTHSKQSSSGSHQ